MFNLKHPGNSQLRAELLDGTVINIQIFEKSFNFIFVLLFFFCLEMKK